MTSVRRVSVLLSGLVLTLAGCGDISYFTSILQGELRLLSSVVPIEQALQDPTLSDEQQEKLAFVVRARDYAAGAVGLDVGSSYQTFANLGDDALAWNLSASRKDAFEPYIWNLPLVGPLPYLGFFTFEEAVAERDKLVEQGYDTLIYEVDAYSTLGVLPDPVTSALLRRDLPSLADTVMHELLHNTIFRTGDTTFNESMATFVGRTAGVEFLIAEFGPDSPEIQATRDGYEDQDRFQAFLQSLTRELQTLYAGDLTYDGKLAEREKVFEAARQRFARDVLPLMHNQPGYEPFTRLGFNNAYLLANVRYNNDQEVFAAVYEATGRSWPETLRHFRNAAGAPDPIAHLQQVAAGSAE